MTHWCRDVQRDIAVRAAEDGRSGPLPTLEECIERQKHAAMTAGVKEGFVKADGEWKRLTENELRQLLVIPKSVSASSAVEPENKGDSMRPPTTKTATVENDFADGPKCSPAVSETGEGQSGLRTERVTLEITHSVPVAGWDWTNILETYRPGESVRVVEESAPSASGAANSPAAPVSAEPVTWGVKLPGHEPFGQDAVWSVRPSEELAKEVFPSSEGWVHFPLFAAPQPASSWLTEEERRLIEIAVKAQRDPYDITGTSQYNARVLRDLLARSSPPEVVLPVSPFTPDSTHAMGWWEAIGKVKKALAAAGVTVKEVGRE